MKLDQLVDLARKSGASDLHLESGLPAAVRIRGELETIGNPIPAEAVVAAARGLLDEEDLAHFLAQRSWDLSRTIAGVRCRANVFQTSRGMGIAIRLLASTQPTLKHLNLHPDIGKLLERGHGLIVVSGPTGSGKSSTMAALVHEINANETQHIITIEHPIEYSVEPRRSYVRQREVGRDTPSFEQAITDAMREDPDVLLIGEVRTQETMRLAMQAAETGHLVMTTLHASSAPETCQRIISSFPAEIQGSVAGQLAGVLVAVLCQRMTYNKKERVRVPELEVLRSTPATANILRSGHFHKLRQTIDLGQQEGMWSFERYREWLNQKRDWYVPARPSDTAPDMPQDIDPEKYFEEWKQAAAAETEHAAVAAGGRRPPAPFPGASPSSGFGADDRSGERIAPPSEDRSTEDVIEIGGADEDVSDLLSQIKRKD